MTKHKKKRYWRVNLVVLTEESLQVCATSKKAAEKKAEKLWYDKFCGDEVSSLSSERISYFDYMEASDD